MSPTRDPIPTPPPHLYARDCTADSIPSMSKVGDTWQPEISELPPWEQVDVDLIGPWKITTSTNRTYGFLALTCVDRVTGLAELIRIDNKESSHVAYKFVE